MNKTKINAGEKFSILDHIEKVDLIFREGVFFRE
jgi:hypothetical protein